MSRPGLTHPLSPGVSVVHRIAARGLQGHRPLRLVAGLLALIAVGLMPGREGVRAADPDPVLARVNRHEIRRSEVELLLSSVPLGQQIDPRENFDIFVLALANHEAIFQWMIGQQFRDEPELRRLVRDLVFNFLQDKYVKQRLRVTDDDVRRYYREHASLVRGEHMRVREILLASREQCEALQAHIRSEADFIEKARALSLDKSSAAEGGDLGYLMKVQGPLGFEPHLFDLKPGQMAIFDTQRGCHLVWIVEHVDPPLLPLGIVQQPIRDFLQNAQERELLEALVSRAREHVTVEILAPAPAEASAGKSR